MKALKSIISTMAISLLAFFAWSTQAAAIENSVTAVNGYDVVSYHTEKKPLRGNGHFLAEHNGATYLFASKKNQEKFEANPEKYVPAYGGYCAFGVSVGKKFVGDPEVWRLVDGRLYLNLDVEIQSQWLKDVPGRIASADRKWKSIRDKAPSSL